MNSDFEINDFGLFPHSGLCEAMFAAGVDARAGPVRSPEAPEPAAPAPAAGKAGTEADCHQEVRREQAIDEVLEDSFPASDPPGWTLGRRSGG